MLEKNIDLRHATALVTGAAGFIGAELSLRLLKDYPDIRVIGVDSITDYYDTAIKEERLNRLALYAPRFTFVRGNIADK